MTARIFLGFISGCLEIGGSFLGGSLSKEFKSLLSNPGVYQN